MRDLNSDLKLKKNFSFNSFCLQNDDCMEALKITEKIIRENDLEHKKKKTRLNSTPG